MATTAEYSHRNALRPVRAVLLAGTVPLFLGALLNDLAYYATYEIQWANFASWLIVGGLVWTAFALLSAAIDLFRAGRGARVPALLLLVTWIAGFFNALVHARDAWAVMPAGLVLSIVVAVLACAATWIGFATLRTGGAE